MQNLLCAQYSAVPVGKGYAVESRVYLKDKADSITISQNGDIVPFAITDVHYRIVLNTEVVIRFILLPVLIH